MKNFKFSKLTLISTYTILVTFLYSCDMFVPTQYPTTPSKWILDKISTNQDKNGTCLYHVTPTEKLSLNMNDTWFVDSIGKFNIGDTLSFQHIPKN